jgi:hypothetical protein
MHTDDDHPCRQDVMGDRPRFEVCGDRIARATRSWRVSTSAAASAARRAVAVRGRSSGVELLAVLDILIGGGLRNLTGPPGLKAPDQPDWSFVMGGP